ncbi:hypothetical protein [Branchiibius cervicis]|uniref:Uncharacterized protein n=1 Tax=Branchiibius cervicis TaxID=908252 RepID=A0ABW2AXI4_9MICO
MSEFPTVLVEQAHSSAWALDRAQAAAMNPANPADASLHLAADALRARGLQVVARREGAVDGAQLRDADVYVIAHPAQAASERVAGSLPPVFGASEIDAIESFVRAGGGWWCWPNATRTPTATTSTSCWPVSGCTCVARWSTRALTVDGATRATPPGYSARSPEDWARDCWPVSASCASIGLE